MREPPAGILAREAGKHWLRGLDLNRQRPAFVLLVEHQRGGAEAAHADFRHPQPDLDAAGACGTRIDQQFSERPTAMGYAVALAVGDDCIDDALGVSVEVSLSVHHWKLSFQCSAISVTRRFTARSAVAADRARASTVQTGSSASSDDPGVWWSAVM